MLRGGDGGGEMPECVHRDPSFCILFMIEAAVRISNEDMEVLL